MDKIEQKYVVIEISDEQLVMMIETDFNLMVENNAQEGIEGYIKRFEGNCVECSDYIFNKGKDSVEIKRIQEMESDLAYMKGNGEHGSSCSDCDHKQGYVNVEPCKSCKNYCNHSKNKKDKSYNEVVTDFVSPVDGQQCPSWVNPTTWNAMQNVQRSINDFFANVSNLKTLNTKTGCLEPMTFESLNNAITKPDFEPKILSSIAESGHKTLTTEAREHAKVIIDYLWDKAREKFEYDFKIVWCYDLNMWTEWCENYIMTHDNLEVGEDPVNHIFYHLMKLKQLYNL